jgi:hypothetical protein
MLAEAATALRAIYEAKAEQMRFEGPFAALLLLLRAAAAFVLAAAAGMADGSEEWGYVQQVIISSRFGSHLESTGVPRSVWCSNTILCRGAHVLVAVPQPAARGQRQDAMANRALVAGRSGE